MKKAAVTIGVIFTIVLGISVSFVAAQEDSKIPAWIKAAVGFWVNGEISDDEFIDIIEYFVENEIINISSQESSDDELVKNLHVLQTELNTKIEHSREIVNLPQIQTAIKESNSAYLETGNPDALVNQIDDKWQSIDPDKENSVAYNLIHNPTGDILRSVMKVDQQSESQFKYVEIFVTNQYGGNVAQTHKTSDFKQSDEMWWQKAKQNVIFLSEGGFDESANVYASDIAIKIVDENGDFIGVLKAVVNIESITQN